MKHGSLFSGIGGFELAAEWMGWENKFHCEWNQFGQRILKHYWPKSISYGDITKTDFTIHRGQIDIITGGFPCQPFSLAGKRKGTEDSRHLWPEMLRAIRDISPRWVVGENVFGIVNWDGGLVFEQVQADLEAAGYEVQPFILPACSVGAPHKRERIWFVAYHSNAGVKGVQSDGENGVYEPEFIANSTGEGLERSLSRDSKLSSKSVKERVVANTDKFNGNVSGLRTSEISQFKTPGIFENTSADTNGRRQPCKEYGKKKSGHPAKKSFSNYWQDFPTQSPVCSGNDGIPSRLDGITFPKWRNESIKAYGNAIVPQIAYQIFKAIKQYEQNQTT